MKKVYTLQETNDMMDELRIPTYIWAICKGGDRAPGYETCNDLGAYTVHPYPTGAEWEFIDDSLCHYEVVNAVGFDSTLFKVLVDTVDLKPLAALRMCLED